MTTLTELFALREAARAAAAERAAANQAALRAATRLAAAEQAWFEADQRHTAARVVLEALRAMRAECDALLVEAADADANAAALEAEITTTESRIKEIQALLAVLPPRSREALPLRLELSRIRSRLPQRRVELAEAVAAAEASRQKASELTAQLDTQMPTATAAYDEASESLRAAVASREARQAADAAARERAQAALDAEAAATNALDAALAGLVGALDPAAPLLMLPVRLETRFGRRRADGARQLRIRVYPDDVHQDAHQPGVTAVEQNSAQSFWTDVWRAGTGAAGEARREAAWQRLAQRHGPRRSLYVAQALAPTNPAARPDQPVPDASRSPTLPNFPAPDVAPASWTQAPRTTVLPDRWLAVGYVDKRRAFAKWGELIPRPLATGPSPADDLNNPADVGPGMRWMVDYAAAVEVGMGITVWLKPQDTQLDRLVVVGVQGTTTADEGAAAIAALLDSHAYSWGLDLVPQGTPTNNDAGRPAGYEAHATGAVASVEGALAAPGDGSDADELVTALGLADPSAAIWSAPHAAETHMRDAREMAAALWPGTWGYYLTQMLAPALRGQPLEPWRRFTIDTVRGRGPLPAIRTGNQPYGVLPITSLTRWQPRGSRPDLVLWHRNAAGDSGHQVLWDLVAAGSWTVRTDHDGDPLPLAGAASPFALRDVDGDGAPELVVLDPGDAAQPPGLWIGPAVTDTGAWQGPFETSLGAAVAIGAGLAFSPDGGVFVARHLSQRLRSRLVVARGESLGPSGVTRWLGTSTVDLGIATRGRLVALAAAKQLVALFVDDEIGLTYRIGSYVRGGALTWTAPIPFPNLVDGPINAASLALHDLDGDGLDELVLVVATPGIWKVWIGAALAADGTVAGWSGPFEIAAPPDLATGGAAITNVARAPSVSLDSPSGLVNLLVKARELWLAAAAAPAVPFVGRGDPDRDILDILSSDALSSSVVARRLLGRIYQDAIWTFVGMPLPQGAWHTIAVECAKQLEGLGLDLPTRLAEAVYVDPPADWRHPWTQDGEPPETGLLKEDYLRWAATVTPEELHDCTGIGDPSPLLFRLVRHSTLQAYADVAMRELPAPSGFLREPELIDIGRFMQGDRSIENDTLTSWRYIHRPQQGRVLGQDAQALSDTGDPRAADLTELRDALSWLAGRSPAALERLLAETLDVAGHRLDAWITAVATARLRELRADLPEGLHIGGYGIVENLEPADGAHSTGYVHAPSVAQATTAAVLRSGYLTHRRDAGDATFNVDLSSRRVRAALELADGIRAGQPLGTLLGYRFERALLDHPTLPLAAQIAGFRQLAPIAAGKLIDVPDGTPVEDVSARNVVDGLALLRLYQAGGIEWGKAPDGQPVVLPVEGSDDHKAVVKILAELASQLDALSDLGIAESVHQAALGNPGRAGATLDALNRGELPPDDHEVARTARSGIGVSHRLLVLLDAPRDDDPDVARWAGGVRAQAEPRLNAWVARLFGDPADVVWSANYPGEPVMPSANFTFAELGLSPLDVLALEGMAPGGDLERRLVLHAVRNAPAGAEGRDPVLDVKPPVAGSTIANLLEVAAAARDLIGAARATAPGDLMPQGETADVAGLPGVATRLTAATGALADGLAELRALFAFPDPPSDRAAIAKALGMALTELGAVDNVLDVPAGADVGRAALALGLPADADAVRSALVVLAACIPGAVPQTAHGDDPVDLRTLADQAAAAARQADRRIVAATAATDPREGFEALLGRGFRVLPAFAPANRASLATALAERRTIGDAGPHVTTPWLAQLAGVREAAGRLDRALLVSEALTAGDIESLQIAQFPLVAGTDERWVALPREPGERIRAGRTSLAVLAPLGLTLVEGKTVAGLMIDDWVEVVPAGEETTAVAFHFDGPGSCAPQALLLAVAPRLGQPWSVPALEELIRETINLVAVRSVDPDAMPGVGQFLPALMLACNLGGDPHGDTISTQAPVA